MRKHSDDSNPQTFRCSNWRQAEQNKLSLSRFAQVAHSWAKVIECVDMQKIIKRANFSNSLLTIQFKTAIVFTSLSRFRFLHSTLATRYICLCYYLLFISCCCSDGPIINPMLLRRGMRSGEVKTIQHHKAGNRSKTQPYAVWLHHTASLKGGNDLLYFVFSLIVTAV